MGVSSLERERILEAGIVDEMSERGIIGASESGRVKEERSET